MNKRLPGPARCLFAFLLLSLPAYAAEVTAPHADELPRIDGTLDDACWSESAVITDFRILGSRKGSEAETVAQLAYTDDFLCIGIRCSDPDGVVAAEHSGHTSPGRDDGVEIFLGPRQGENEYAHFRLGAGGAYYEQKVDGRRKDMAWRTPWQHATVIDKTGWTAEIAIPLYVLGTGSVGSVPLAFNITRSHAAGEGRPEYITWAPLEGMFHDPDHFGGLAGLENHDLPAACVPMVAEAVALNYEVDDKAFGYVLELDLVNSGGRAGRAVLDLEDRPADGTPRTVSMTVEVPPVGHQTVTWTVPVPASGLGPRRARVSVRNGPTDTWTEVDHVDRLALIKAFPGQSYYTEEVEAEIVCSAVFTREQAARAGFALEAEVRDTEGQILHRAAFPSIERYTVVKVPLTDLAPGAFDVMLTLRDGTKREIATTRTQLVKRTPGPATEVKFDYQKEQMLVDGEPFFPIGYMARSREWPADLFRMFGEADVNCLVYWSGVVGGGQKAVDAELLQTVADEVKRAQEHGIYFFLPMLKFGPSLRYNMKDLEERLETHLDILPEVLTYFRNHKGVVGYYGLDEPPPRYYRYAEGLNRLLREHDPYRILYSSNCGDWHQEGYDYYDLLGRHGYWMPYLMFSPNKLAKRSIIMRALARKMHKPFVTTPQGFWREESRKITPQEIRASYYMPLIQGSKGLIIFVYSDYRYHPAEFKAQARVFGEVRQLAPILLEPSPLQNVAAAENASAEPMPLPDLPAPELPDFGPLPDNWRVLELPPAQVLVKNHPAGGEVILVANTAQAPRDMIFTLNSLTEDTRIVNFFDPDVSYARIGDQAFTDHFEAWDIRVYRTMGRTSRTAGAPVRMAVNVVGDPGAEPAPGVNVLADREPGFGTEQLGPSWEVREGTRAWVKVVDHATDERCLAVESNPDGWATVRLKEVPLKAEATYKFSFRFSSTITEGKEAPHALVLVPRRHGTPPRFTVTPPLDADGWQTFSKTFDTDQAVTAEILLRRQGGRGTFCFDDLRIEQVADKTQEPKNLLKNASFEACTYFGQPDWWLTRETTSDQDRRLNAWEYVTDDVPAVHGAHAIRAGFWRSSRPPRGVFRNLAQRFELDLGENYVFSIYLKADVEGLPVTLFLRDMRMYRKAEGPGIFSRQVEVGTQWQRYVLQAPFKQQGFRGTRQVQLALRVDSQGNIFADAAQLEAGREPTAFEADSYRAPDIGPGYDRESVEQYIPDSLAGGPLP